MKKSIKVIAIFILIISANLIFNSVFFHNHDTDIDAVKSISASNIDKILFKYETESDEILFCQNENQNTYECILKKRNLFVKAKYRNEISWTSALLTSPNVFNEVNPKLKYAVLDNEDDLERFDYDNAELKKYEFSYSNINGHYNYKYVYIIDETGENFEVVNNFYN